MGIYKNDYKESEDATLWEIHEIRHSLHKKIKKQSIEEINKNAMQKFLTWTYKTDFAENKEFKLKHS